ncbi:MAG: hypothetical protein JOZ40_24585 [Methylobacteriaceae bacterium]|nr:hypothetical protein [Methylobacteriaceae bacterium]
MGGLLFAGTDNGFWVFLIMTVILGGSAAWATGRALAKTWRPFGQVFVYVIGLGGAVHFLHHALFGEAFLSLHYYLVDVVILAVAASLGYRRMRAQQMVTQYSFSFDASGPFGWSAKPANK